MVRVRSSRRTRNPPPMALPLSHRSPELRRIYQYLVFTRIVLRAAQGVRGGGLTVAVFLSSLCLAGLFDLAFPRVSAAVRLPGLVAVLMLSLATAFFFLFRPLLKRITNQQLATRIEASAPSLENRLVTCIDLDGKEGVPQRLWDRLIRETMERFGRKDRFWSGHLPLAPMLRAWLLGAGACGLALLLSWSVGRGFAISVERVLHPFADLPPETDVNLEWTPVAADVLSGEEIPFEVRVTSGSAEAFRLELTGEPGSKPIALAMEKVEEGRFRKTVRGLQSEQGYARRFSFRMFGAGTWTTEGSIVWVDRPSIRRLQTRLRFPDYMGISRSPVELADPRAVSGPHGSVVELLADVIGEANRGFIELSEPRLVRRVNESRTDRPWHATRSQFPEGSKRTGTWTWDETLDRGPDAHLSEGSGFSSHGFTGSAPFAVERGEVLFVNVFLDPDRPPEMIALEFTPRGGESEHRVFWGKDRFEVGVPGTASRRHFGELPEKGKWVRLEVPALGLNLEAKSLTAVSFIASGGRVGWFQVGASEPSVFEETEWTVTESIPMNTGDEGRWTGSFPLRGIGRFRLQVENRLRHANRTDEGIGTFEATPDRPPEVVIEKPGRDLSLPGSRSVPLQVAVTDDYGMKEVSLAVRRNGQDRFRKFRELKQYPVPDPARSDTIQASLDPKEVGLKPGESIQYRVEVRDHRPDGQLVLSKEFTLTVEPELPPEKRSRPLTEAFQKLVQEQDKIRERLEQLLKEKNPDEEGELQKLAEQEAKNAELARQTQEELAKLNQEGKQNPKQNPELAKRREQLEKKVKDKASQPLEELTEEMKQAAKSEAGKRNLQDLLAKAKDLQQNLQQLSQQAEEMAKLPPEMPASPNNGKSPDGTATQGQNPSGMIGASLKELDERTRNLIMQMPLRVREELLQSMNERGPEGFQTFIQDYFRRLSELPPR